MEGCEIEVTKRKSEEASGETGGWGVRAWGNGYGSEGGWGRAGVEW